MVSFYQTYVAAVLEFSAAAENILTGEIILMERIKTIETRNLCQSAKKGGCGECQTSCQSACKTSCGVANQKCEQAKN